MKESAIVHPTDQIVLGEKTDFHEDYYMDVNEGTVTGAMISEAFSIKAGTTLMGRMP